MGSSKKHKKHKSERREKYEDRQFCLERPPGLKLIFKVGASVSTPEHAGNDSPTSAVLLHHQHPNSQPSGLDSPDGGGSDCGAEYTGDKPKKSKKKKKKKDREKRHKHHHKEKRRRERESTVEFGNDSSQEDLQDAILKYAGMSAVHSLANSPVTKPMVPLLVRSPPFGSFGEAFRPSSATLDASINTGVASPVSQSASRCAGSPQSSAVLLQSPASDCSSSDRGREPRTCVLKQKQARSPLSKLLDNLLRALEKKDPHQFFAWPVTDDIAPGYSSIISEPMDFLSIRQKVDQNAYGTLQEFADDFRLMCDNAIRYNHVDTVYHKAARRLLHVGAKMLTPESLLRPSLRPLLVYMRALTPRELGFDLAQTSDADFAHGPDSDAGGGHSQFGATGGCGAGVDSADEGASTGAEDRPASVPPLTEEEERRQQIRRENAPQSRFEAYADDLTADEVLAQVQSAAKRAHTRVQRQRRACRMGFLRQNRDGTTSMRIMIANSNDCPERVVSVGAFTGRLQQGTGQLQGFREDRRNAAKIVKPLTYGTFCSFAPTYDSRFANLSKEESELVLATYGDETGMEYASSILDFSRNSSYASTLANGLLDILTQGEHRRTMGDLMESQYQRYERDELEQRLQTPSPPVQVADGDSAPPIDFDALRTLSDIGVDVGFLDVFAAGQATLDEQLHQNTQLIEQLYECQNARLSQPLPQHLSNVPRPGVEEFALAAQVSENLATIAKQVTPAAVVDTQALRQAMGMPAIVRSPVEQQSASAPPKIGANDVANDTDTSSVSMELEPEAEPASSSVQRDSEFRQMLQ